MIVKFARQCFRKLKLSARHFISKTIISSKGVAVGPRFLVGRNTQIKVLDGSEFRIGSDVYIGCETSICVFRGGKLVIEDSVVINRGCLIECRGHLIIGRDSLLNMGVIIYCNGEMTIGASTLLAPYVFLMDHDHKIDRIDIPIKAQGSTDPKPITIRDGAWLGTKVTVTKGVTIGEGAIIGANAVVTKDMPPYAVAVGIPAQVIRYRASLTDVNDG